MGLVPDPMDKEETASTGQLKYAHIRMMKNKRNMPRYVSKGIEHRPMLLLRESSN